MYEFPLYEYQALAPDIPVLIYRSFDIVQVPLLKIEFLSYNHILIRIPIYWLHYIMSCHAFVNIRGSETEDCSLFGGLHNAAKEDGIC
jgi:hypothetical protein